MKPKLTIKIIVDIAMTVLFLICMGYHLTENGTHEWLGVSLFVLFIVHHVLNLGWYRNAFKGKYTAVRIIHTVINLLLTADILLIAASGIMLSRNVFAFLNVSGGMTGRLLHMISTAWGYVLMAMHLGLHWGMAVAMSRKLICKAFKRPVRPTQIGKIAGGIVAAGISAYGIYAFIHREIAERLFLLVEYAFFDFTEAPVFFFLDYLAILVLFAAITYYSVKTARILSMRKRKSPQNENHSEKNTKEV